MHIAKKGLRVLGIAESFTGTCHSILAGVVMRKDLRIDGFGFVQTTVGGMDATDSAISLFRGFKREDINLMMLGGGVISWYNIIDPERIARETGKGILIVTYRNSEGIDKTILHHFPADTERIAAYRNLGERVPVSLPTGQVLYIRSFGITVEDAAKICADFTFDGKIPEPIRIARLVARSVMHFDTLRMG